MALNIRNPETEELAEALARLTGETKTETVKHALRDRSHQQRPLADELDEIAIHCANLPVLDPRSADEILGYDENGIAR